MKKMRDNGIEPTNPAYQKMQTNLNNTKADMVKIQKEIDDTSKKLKSSKVDWKGVADTVKTVGSAVGETAKAMAKACAAMGAAIGAVGTAIAARLKRSAAAIYEELKRGYTGEFDCYARPKYSADLAQATVQENFRRRGNRRGANC